MIKREISLGQKFNNWTIIKETETRTRHRYFLAKCICGTQKEVKLINLTTGRSKSCGCTAKDWHRAHTGDTNPAWKGGKRVIEGDYIEIYKPDHPTARSNGYIKEHRYVMEVFLGRPLLKSETIHHKNGNKSDNRIENLELWSSSQPPGQRVEDKVAWAMEILELYETYNASRTPR